MEPDAKESCDLEEISFKLQKYVELHDNNKLTKDNAWTNDAIDLFHTFSKNLKETNYRFIGQCLTAVTRVYVLRLDSLYDDAVRMSSFLNRKGVFIDFWSFLLN